VSGAVAFGFSYGGERRSVFEIGAVRPDTAPMTAAVLTARDALAARRGDARLVVGLIAAAIGAAHFAYLAWSPALAAALVTAAATGLGAVPVLFVRRLSDRMQASLLGFGGGVMLAAAGFALLLPAIEAGLDLAGNRAAAAAMVAASIAAGGGVLAAMDRALPHEHFVTGVDGARGHDVARIWLFVFAIALHNLPEGLAVGVGYGQAEAARADALALAIALQNMPEGLVVAAALAAAGYGRAAAVLTALATGFVEPLGAVLGASAVAASSAMLPAALAFAGGAMLWVVGHEIVPASHRTGHGRTATAALLAGFAAMLFLDTLPL
jgi:ZIP family zinc transporter